jgi:hypothetical protein
MTTLLWDMEDIMSGQDTPETSRSPPGAWASGSARDRAGDPLRKSPVYPSQSSLS